MKMIIEKVDERRDDFATLGSNCFNHCSEEKLRCLASAVNSMLCLGSKDMNCQKLTFIWELILPFHETVGTIEYPKWLAMKKESCCKKAQSI